MGAVTGGCRGVIIWPTVARKLSKDDALVLMKALDVMLELSCKLNRAREAVR